MVTNLWQRRRLGRRAFLKLGGLTALGAAGATVLRALPHGRLATGAAADTAVNPKVITLAATDGFMYLPGVVPNPNGPGTVLPDPLAEPPLTMWAFGFRDVTGFSDSMIQNQRGRFQAPAPLLWTDQERDTEITLHNLGMVIRPDLTDGHTIHWHGFRNATPIFDGVPEMSIAVPINRQFTYFYRPHDPGTYMYHCHFEDTEHVSMGMTGIVFVRPIQNVGNGTDILVARAVDSTADPTTHPLGYAYNDGRPTSDPASTRYDREYGLFLHEAWALEHFEGAHIQEHDWSEYEPDLWTLNGRCWPDTVAPSGLGHDADGDLVPAPGFEYLKYNPISSLIEANAGERVLLRFVNLGFQQHAMTVDAIPLRIVGKDATLLANGGTDLTYLSQTVYIGPGESVDAIFEAPAYAGGGSEPDRYRLYNRNLAYLHNPGLPGLGGQMTEIRVYPPGTLLPQTEPHSYPGPA